VNEEEKRFALFSSTFIGLVVHQEPDQSTQYHRIWRHGP